MIDFQKPKVIDKEIILIPDKVVMTKMDKEGILEFANEYFVEVSGYEEFELMGKSIFCVQHPDMPDVLFKWMWEKLNKQENFNFPVKAIAKNGKFYWSVTDFSFKVDGSNNTLAIFNRRKYASREVINYFDNLYSKIKSIEAESGIVLAEKYLIGHLEEKEKTIKEIIFDLDTDIRIKDIVSPPKTISKIKEIDDLVFEAKPVQIDVESLYKPKREVVEKPIVKEKVVVQEKPKVIEQQEEELTIQERIDRIREKANRVSSQTISKPKEINEVILPVAKIVEPIIQKRKIEISKPIKKEAKDEKSKEDTGKKSIFQKLFGKTDEEIEEGRKRRQG